MMRSTIGDRGATSSAREEKLQSSSGDLKVSIIHDRLAEKWRDRRVSSLKTVPSHHCSKLSRNAIEGTKMACVEMVLRMKCAAARATDLSREAVWGILIRKGRCTHSGGRDSASLQARPENGRPCGGGVWAANPGVRSTGEMARVLSECHIFVPGEIEGWFAGNVPAIIHCFCRSSGSHRCQRCMPGASGICRTAYPDHVLYRGLKGHDLRSPCLQNRPTKAPMYGFVVPKLEEVLKPVCPCNTGSGVVRETL